MHKVFDDDGSVTIEAALALSSLVLVAAGIVGAIATLASYIAAVDMAGAAARARRPPRTVRHVPPARRRAAAPPMTQ